MPRKIMRKYRMGEISGVDRPAQKGALMALIKNDEPPKESPMDKKYEDMTEAEKANHDKLKKADENAAALAKANKVIALKSDERVHHDALPEADRDAFLALDDTARATAVEAATVEKASANPVVYKSADGDVFRKNDDPRLAKMAKQADDADKAAAVSKAAQDTAVYTKRAGDELGNLGGTEAGRAALLKAVDGIKDEAVRKEAAAALKSGNDAAAGNFDTKGVRISKSDASLTVAKSDSEQAVAEIMQRDGCTKSQAIIKMMKERPDVAKAARGQPE